MNRRQKIILSLTVIGIVLLVIIGLTYAYFLTRINGNTETKSISVSTANLALVYGDGNDLITGTNILPGTSLEPKTFTVTNQGNAKTGYVVTIEDVKVTWTTSGTTTDEEGNEVSYNEGDTTKFETNDFVYTLTCKSYLRADYEANPETATETGTCSGTDSEITFPMNGGIAVGNSSDVNTTHVYSLVVTYKDTGIDQSADMNKTLVAKVNIKNITDINPYSSDTTSLAYNIINNAVGLTVEERESGYAELVATPLTIPAQEISADDESVLSITQDDLGTSYYYRGNVENNYVEFNGMCWRIVRIEGDGSVKITLAAQKACSEITNEDIGSAFIGTAAYNSNNSFDYDNGEMKETLVNWLDGKVIIDEVEQDRFSTEIKSKLKTTSICIGNSTTKYNLDGTIATEEEAAVNNYWRYEPYIRLGKTASLLCNEGDNKSTSAKIYPLTADEVVFAGGKLEEDNRTFYLLDEILDTNVSWHTITPAGSFQGENMAIVFGNINSDIFDYGIYLRTSIQVRPAVSLIEGTTITSGDGSITNPYVVS